MSEFVSDPKYAIEEDHYNLLWERNSDGKSVLLESGTYEIWNKVCQSESMGEVEDFLKVVATSSSAKARRFTSIDAYAQIRKATELFGPMGRGWGFKDIELLASFPMTKYTKRGEQQGVQLLFKGTFFYMWRGTRDEIVVIDDVFTDASGDSAKKVMTDMITKALSYLGWNFDVFLGRFNDVKTISSPASKEQKAAFMAAIESLKPEKKAAAIKYHEDNNWNRSDVLADTKKFIELKAKVEALRKQNAERATQEKEDSDTKAEET